MSGILRFISAKLVTNQIARGVSSYHRPVIGLFRSRSSYWLFQCYPPAAAGAPRKSEADVSNQLAGNGNKIKYKIICMSEKSNHPEDHGKLWAFGFQAIAEVNAINVINVIPSTFNLKKIR